MHNNVIALFTHVLIVLKKIKKIKNTQMSQLFFIETLCILYCYTYTNVKRVLKFNNFLIYSIVIFRLTRAIFDYYSWARDVEKNIIS